MTIRKVSYAAYRRNMSFWIGRQERGEEIRFMPMGQVVGVLYGAPFVDESRQHLSPRLRLHHTVRL